MTQENATKLSTTTSTMDTTSSTTISSTSSLISDEPSYFDQLAGRDMTMAYKLAGGLGTAAGRQLYMLYNQSEAKSRKHSLTSVYIQKASRVVKKAPADPDADHRAKIQAKNQELLSKRNAYKAPLPVVGPQKPALSRNAMMLAAIPRRKPQTAIEREAKIENESIARSASAATTAVTMRETRERQIERLQSIMENGGAAKIPSTVSKGSLRNRGLAVPPPPKSEEEKLFDSILNEIQEREHFLAKMRQLKGDAKLTRQEAADFARVQQEVRERMEELKRVHELIP